MNVKYLVQYKHPIYHTWITDTLCASLKEADDVINKRKNEEEEVVKYHPTPLKWRILPSD